MSDFSFFPYQIFEIIAKTEATVSRFYDHLARLGLGEEASKVFRILSSEESEHGKIFLKMAQAQKESHASARGFSLNIRGILEDAIQRIDRSLLSLTPMDRSHVDLRQCIEIAMSHEKDSIKVYQSMQHALPHDFSEIFEKTIAVEKGHLKVLEGILKDPSRGRA